MSWTNVNIRSSFDIQHDREKNLHDLKSDLDYWKKRCTQAEDALENIPQAMEEFGWVDIRYENKLITLHLAPSGIKKIE